MQKIWQTTKTLVANVLAVGILGLLMIVLSPFALVFMIVYWFLLLVGFIEDNASI